MMFLLGREAMFGQEPPTYFRSMTAVFIPFLARVQEMSLPAAPLPSTRRSYSSGEVGVFICSENLFVDCSLVLWRVSFSRWSSHCSCRRAGFSRAFARPAALNFRND